MKVKVLKHKTLPNLYGVIQEYGRGIEVWTSAVPQLFGSTATLEDLLALYRTAGAQTVVESIVNDFDLIEMNIVESTIPKRRAKIISEDGEFNFLERMRREDDARPWWQRAYKAFEMYKWIVYCTLSHVIGQNPYHRAGADRAAQSIKDDIEFGYDLNMIYGKIMNGNYGNTALPKKRNWFERNNIQWDFFLDRQGGATILQTLKSELEFSNELKTKEDVIEWIRTHLKNYIAEKQLRMEAAGLKVEDETDSPE